MGFFDGLNPVVGTSNTYAKVLKRQFEGNWKELEDNMPTILSTLAELRAPMKKRFPSVHQRFVEDCMDNRFPNITEFVLEIVRIEFYHKQGFIPLDQEKIHTDKIQKALRKKGLPENIISGHSGSMFPKTRR